MMITRSNIRICCYWASAPTYIVGGRACLPEPWWVSQSSTWFLKGKGKVNVDLYSASKALRYGTRSQEISQSYLHTPRSSANGMNHTCLWYVPRPV